MLNMDKFISSLLLSNFQSNKSDQLLDKIYEATIFAELPLDSITVYDIYDAMDGTPAYMERLKDIQHKLIEIPRTNIVPEFF